MGRKWEASADEQVGLVKKASEEEVTDEERKGKSVSGWE